MDDEDVRIFGFDGVEHFENRGVVGAFPERGQGDGGAGRKAGLVVAVVNLFRGFEGLDNSARSALILSRGSVRGWRLPLFTGFMLVFFGKARKEVFRVVDVLVERMELVIFVVVLGHGYFGAVLASFEVLDLDGEGVCLFGKAGGSVDRGMEALQHGIHEWLAECGQVVVAWRGAIDEGFEG